MRTTPFRATSLVLVIAGLGVFSCGDDGSSSKVGPAGGTSSGGSSGSGNTGGGTGATGGAGNAGSGGDGGTIMLPDSGSGGEPILDGSGCAEDEFEGDRVPANMVFVIDQSGSMNCNLPQDGQTTAECEAFPQKEDTSRPSKWELTRGAIKDALTALQAPDTSVGVSMFPSAGSDCGVWRVDPTTTPPTPPTPDVAVTLLDAAQVTGIQSFLDTVAPAGSTPIAGATILAYDYLHRTLNATGNKFVVLLTDGAESCKASELPKLIGTDVQNARAVNIRTFVIGVPGSEDGRSLLSQLAFEGGTPRSATCNHAAAPPDAGDCHFDMTTTTNFSVELAMALDQISGSVLTCEFDVPSGGAQAVDLGKVNVKVNGADILKDTADCGTASNGWQYNSTNTKIILCGQACDDAVQPDAKVKIVLGCPTKIVQ